MVSEIGQVGTQFDGFGHQSHPAATTTASRPPNRDPSGFPKLGVHNVGTLIARAVLIDIAGYKGVDMLGDNYEITVADLEGAVEKQNITFQPGDAIIINTGWGKLWGKQNARY